MPSCSIKQCSTRRSRNQPELSVHRFPKSEVLRQKWLEAIGTENLNARHNELYICSLHFEESQFNRTLDVIRLRDNAVPTFIMPPGNIHNQADTGTKKPREKMVSDREMPPVNNHEPVTEMKRLREKIAPDCKINPPRYRPTTSTTAYLRPTASPLLGTGLLSSREGLGYSPYAGPVRCEDFTHILELLRRCVQVSSRCFPSTKSSVEMPTGARFLVISADDSNPKGPRIRISPSIPNKQQDTTTGNDTKEVDPDKSSVLEACRVCLAVDCKMFQLKKRKLRQAYTNVTGIPVSPDDGHPQLLCWECAARVEAAAQLRARALNAHGILDALLRLNGSVKMGDIRSINRQQAKLSSQLSCEYFEPDEYVSANVDENLTEIMKSENFDDNDLYENEEYIDEEFINIGYEHYEVDGSIVRKDEIDETQGDDKVLMTNDVEIIYDYKHDADDNDDDDDDELASENTEQLNTNKLNRPVKKGRYKKQTDYSSRLKFLSKFFTITSVSMEEAIAAVRDREHSEAYKNAPFKCDICFRGYPTLRRYEVHAVKHTENFGSVECAVCKQRYKSRLHLVRHLDSHRRKYACKQCDVVASASTAALYHRASHEGTIFQCPHCPRTFNKRTTYYGHLRIKHASEFVCELCGHTFLSNYGVEIHKNRRHVLDNMTPLEGPYCDACDVTFVSHKAYKTHLTMSSRHNKDDQRSIVNDYEPKPRKPRRKRGGAPKGRPVGVPNTQTPVTCEQCGLELDSVMSYVSHFRRRHPGDTRAQHLPKSKPLVCDQCGRKFHCKSLLKDHLAAHSGQRLSCDECGKLFSSKVRLAFHMKVHQPTRPTYPCRICGKVFTQSGNMKRHLLKHMIPLPYKCEACGKRLTTPTGLKSHVDHVHNGVPWPKRTRHRGKE